MSRTKTNKARKGRFGKSLFKIARFLFGFATTLLLAGFALFITHINSLTPPKTLAKADGIVVLTGKGGGRLEAGGWLLQEQYGERLLISGVNPAIDEEQISVLLALDAQSVACCVDLDYEAENTVDNGKETANWARALGYERIILVTSAYHMPRAKVEISAAMGGITIIPYPVKSTPNPDEPWWGGREKLSRYIREYAKLLVSYSREPGARPEVR